MKNLLIACCILAMMPIWIGNLTAGTATAYIASGLEEYSPDMPQAFVSNGTSDSSVAPCTVNKNGEKYIDLYNSGGKEIFSYHTKDLIHEYCISGDGKRVAASCGGHDSEWSIIDNKNIKIIGNSTTGVLTKFMTCQAVSSIEGVALNGDGTYVALICASNINTAPHNVELIKSNDDGTGTEKMNFKIDAYSVKMIALSDGDAQSTTPYVAILDTNNTLDLVTPDNANPQGQGIVIMSMDFNEKVDGISISNDGTRIAVWHGDTIDVVVPNYDAMLTGKSICTFIRNDISSVAISGDGKRVGYTYNNATAEIRDCDNTGNIKMSDWLNSVVPINCIIKPFDIALDETGNNLYLYRTCNAIATYSVPASSSSS